MKRFLRGQKNKLGLPPGSMVFMGEQTTDRVKIAVTDYGKDYFRETELDGREDLPTDLPSDTHAWIHVNGLHDAETIEKIGRIYNLHPLVLEDVLNMAHRPKMEDVDDTVFLVLKAFYADETGSKISTEQLSLVLGENFLLSFQEGDHDIFQPVRKRLRNPQGRIRTMGLDYLLYALMDTVVDNYFVVLEQVGERIEAVEEYLADDLNQEVLAEIHQLKRDLLFLRKSIWPLRDVIGRLGRGDWPVIQPSTSIYLRDLHDHAIQVIDTLESFREMVSTLFDIYMSGVSNRTNEVMKVLTIIATMFIPLTFVAGIYGMNFEHMPELKWRWGYPFAWGVMGLVGISMVLFFKKKKWL